MRNLFLLILACALVTAAGCVVGDLDETYTDALGIYAFENLDPSAHYNLVVNAAFTENGFVAIDGNHAFDVRDNVALVAGPDAWHGENFALPY